MRDDDTIRAFEELSAWNLASQDTAFDYRLDEDENDSSESGSGVSDNEETDDDIEVRSDGM